MVYDSLGASTLATTEEKLVALQYFSKLSIAELAQERNFGIFAVPKIGDPNGFGTGK